MLKKLISLMMVVSMTLALLVSCAGEKGTDTNGETTDTGSKGNDQVLESQEGVGTDTLGKTTVWLCYEDIYNNGDEEDITKYKYDENGYMIEETKNYAGGNQRTTVYEYDDDGNNVKMTLNVNGKEIWEVYRYDSNRRLIERKGYYMDGTETLTFKYDDYGNLVEETETDSPLGKEDKTEDKKNYIYDSNGNIIEYFRYYNGKAYMHETYKYDDKGNYIEYTSYDTDGAVEAREYFKYDENGNKIEEVSSYSDGSGGHYIYKYNSKGQMTEKYERSDGKDELIHSYKYDDNGNTIEEIYDHDPSSEYDNMIRYVYEYDEQGRLVKTTEYFNGKERECIESKYDEYGNIVERSVYSYSSGQKSFWWGHVYKYIAVQVSDERAEEIKKEQEQ